VGSSKTKSPGGRAPPGYLPFGQGNIHSCKRHRRKYPLFLTTARAECLRVHRQYPGKRLPVRIAPELPGGTEGIGSPRERPLLHLLFERQERIEMGGWFLKHEEPVLPRPDRSCRFPVFAVRHPVHPDAEFRFVEQPENRLADQ